MNFKVELPKFKDEKYNVLDFGAKAVINFNNQKAFQDAIDLCSKSGGGTVIIPDGYYFTGPIEIKSNVNLYIHLAGMVFFNSICNGALYRNRQCYERRRKHAFLHEQRLELFRLSDGDFADGLGIL